MILRLGLLGSMLLLSSCAIWPSTQEEPEPKTSPQLLEQWDLRLAVVAQGTTSGRAAMHWRQSGDEFSIVVSGPFGAGATRLSGRPEQVVVKRGKQEYISTDPAADLAAATGAPLPLGQLNAWVRGLPNVGHTGPLPEEWAVEPWRVEVVERAEIDGYALPLEMVLRGPNQTVTFKRMRWQSLAQ